MKPPQLADDYVSYHWRNPKTGVLHPRNTTPAWWHELYRLWRLGLNDGEISRALARNDDTIWRARTRMGLTPNDRPGGYREPT